MPFQSIPFNDEITNLNVKRDGAVPLRINRLFFLHRLHTDFVMNFFPLKRSDECIPRHPVARGVNKKNRGADNFHARLPLRINNEYSSFAFNCFFPSTADSGLPMRNYSTVYWKLLTKYARDSEPYSHLLEFTRLYYCSRTSSTYRLHNSVTAVILE